MKLSTDFGFFMKGPVLYELLFTVVLLSGKHANFIPIVGVGKRGEY